MPAGILREAEFHYTNEFLGVWFAVQMHIPALRDEPILKAVEGDFTSDDPRQPEANLRFDNHAHTA